MSSASRPVPVAGPVFLRQLARVAGPGPDAGAQAPLAATLAQWIDWPRAVALAGALDGRPADAGEAPAPDPAIAGECTAAQARLREAILADPLLAVSGPSPADAEPGFAPFRACHQAHQRAMLAATGRLRGRLRDLVAAAPTLARLAEVDAALEQALAPREHALLGRLPDLLDGHFARLRAQHVPGMPGAWLDRFRLDLRDLLLAELDLRFSPVHALLAALANDESLP
ncbi:uncharacterized protein DUF3348 [Luteimonas sp. J16]|jgi:hypothetical protein|uniref:DUF3348 family protein n=1 Tax=unclassified Luteimonas TaxID=2629088 RepID=UPI00047CABBA|nr:MULTISPECIES: DUF3348 family protein [unclassified Luteimonas]TWG94370.1 uncharacterized protein DUF3348 [Luteimonas sp. J16]